MHWYRNILKDVPKSKVKDVAAMLKAIHAQEDRDAAQKKIADVSEKLRSMKLGKAAEHVQESAHETLSYMNYPSEHWRKIRTNARKPWMAEGREGGVADCRPQGTEQEAECNPLERVIREVRRRTRVVGAFPDGQSALMLVSARLRHIAGTHWGVKRYMKMDAFGEKKEEAPSTLVG